MEQVNFRLFWKRIEKIQKAEKEVKLALGLIFLNLIPILISQFEILIIGDKDGTAFIYVFGVYLILTLELNYVFGYKRKIHNLKVFLYEAIYHLRSRE
jgi:hypothetical protein